VIFAQAATGDQAPKTGTNLTFNSNTGLLTSTLFAGDLTGDLTGDVTGDVTGDLTGDASGSSASCTGLSATTTALATGRAIGGTTFDGTAAINIANIIVADTTDTTCSVALFESATGNTLAPKTDGGITYNAGTGTLTATAFAGPLTGNVTGNASGTALTVTQAAQTAITSVGSLTSLGVGAITTSGTLTMGDNTITGIKKLDTDIDVLTEAGGGTTDIDFDDNEEETLSLTAAIIFTGSNMAIGKHKTIHIACDGTDRAFTFPAWVFLGDEPTTATADKKSALSLTCLGSAIGDVRAVFAEEG